MRLAPEFWAKPFAHRALHDTGLLRPENSISAVRAAIAGGYAIELDVQMSADGEAMVFHDYELARLTGRDGRADALSAQELGAVPLLHGDGETIPTLRDVLVEIDGQVPVLIEVKDQSGAFGPTDGALSRRVCETVRDLDCVETSAIMSFNPFEMGHARDALPELARGIVSYDFEHPHDAHVDAAHRAALARLAHFEEMGADFVSYGVDSLGQGRLTALREAGVPIFCWTVRSAEQAAGALSLCDQITFEGFLP